MHSSCIYQKLQFCRLHDKAYAIWRIGFHIRDFKYPSKIEVNILPTTKNIGTSYSHRHSSLSLAGRFILNSNLLKCLIQLIAICLPMLKNDPFVINQLQLISTYEVNEVNGLSLNVFFHIVLTPHRWRAGSFFFCSLTPNYLFWEKRAFNDITSFFFLVLWHKMHPTPRPWQFIS